MFAVRLALGGFFMLGSVPAAHALTDQGNFRWRNDDGNESTATYAAAENAPVEGMAKGDIKRYTAYVTASDNETYSDYNFYRSSSVDANDGFNDFGNLRAAVTDAADGYAYYAADGSGGIGNAIIKVRLSDMAIVGYVNQDDSLASLGNITVGVIDNVHHFAFFGTDEAPAHVYRLDLGSFAIDSSTTLGDGFFVPVVNHLRSGFMDATDDSDDSNDYAYFASQTSSTGSPFIVKIPYYDVTAYQTGEVSGYGTDLRGAALDPQSNFPRYGYFSVGASPATLLQVDLDDIFTGSPAFVSNSVSTEEDSTVGLLMSNETNAVYSIGDDGTSHLRVTKTPVYGSWTTISNTHLDTSDPVPVSVISDHAVHFGYFDKVFVNLHDMTRQPIDPSLFSGEDPQTAAYDYLHAYLYYGSAGSPTAKITKIDVALGSSLNISYMLRPPRGCGYGINWTQIPVAPPTNNEAWEIADSSNLTYGDPTICSGLTAPAGTILTGQVVDGDSVSNATDSHVRLSYGTSACVSYTLEATSDANDASWYCMEITSNTYFNPSDNRAAHLDGSGVVDEPPVANPDTYATPYGTMLSTDALSSGVIVNDTDPQGLMLTFTKDTDPANGDLVFLADGSFTYTPHPGFSGKDTFTYHATSVNDAHTVTYFDSAPATVTIFVTGTNVQSSTLWRNDDGGEGEPPPPGGASAAAAENTAIDIATGSSARLRLGIRGTDAPTNVSLAGSSPLNPGESAGGMPAAIDETHGYAYYADVYSQTIIKVDLSGPTVVDRLDVSSYLPSYEYLATILIDPTADLGGGFAYVSTGYGHILRIQLSTFSVDTVSASLGYGLYAAAGLDAAHGYGYWISNDYLTPQMVRINLSDLTVADHVTISTGNFYYYNGGIDAASETAYAIEYGGSGDHGSVVKIDVDHLTSMSVVGSPLPLPAGDGYVGNSLVDPNDPGGPKLYVTGGFDFGWIAKVDLTSFTVEDNMQLSTIGSIRALTIDAADEYMYLFGSFGTGIVKVRLSDFAFLGNTNIPGIAYFGYSSFYSSAHDAIVAYDYSNNAIVELSTLHDRSYRLEYCDFSANDCTADYMWTAVPASAGSEHWEMSPSTYLTDGQATTNLSGLTDPTVTFVAGEAKDATNDTGPIALNSNSRFSELEYSIRPTTNAIRPESYRFRLTDAGSSALFTYEHYGQADLVAPYVPPPGGPTTNNRILMTRLKASTPSLVSLSFDLTGTISTQLTVSFDAAFSGLDLTGVSATTPDAPGCMSNFQLVDGHTFTADKASCTGPVLITGFHITNPSTPGEYPVTWVNDAPGGGAVYIVVDDQVVVDATVDPSITFNVGSQPDTGSCGASFTDGGAVALGVLSPAGVTSSDQSGIAHICTKLSTNALHGAVVSVASANGKLKSASTADFIPSNTGTIATGDENYGLCADSGGDTGKDVTTPTGATPTAASPFDGGSCTATAHAVGHLTTAPQTVWTLDSASQNAYYRLLLKASASPTTPAHADYADVLTFVATGIY